MTSEIAGEPHTLIVHRDGGLFLRNRQGWRSRRSGASLHIANDGLAALVDRDALDLSSTQKAATARARYWLAA